VLTADKSIYKKLISYLPAEPIDKHRIEKARLMLHNRYESITTIADESGFCNWHHFSKIFKIYTSM
jgi:AraC-like DNA-binding protein